MRGMWTQVQVPQNRPQAQVPQFQRGPQPGESRCGAGVTHHTPSTAGQASSPNRSPCPHPPNTQ
ncbi:hypothetical protein BC826DRAFT_1047521, partial [Russula brevipes]